MSVSNRFPLDPEKLQALSKEDSISLINILSKNLKYTPSQDCLQHLTPLLCVPEAVTEAKVKVKVNVQDGYQHKKKKKKKIFDISNYRQRHIAFHVYYDGAKYSGG